MAVIGDQLALPENGWQRYDDTDPVVVYTGTWSTETLAGNYGGSAKYTSASGSTMSFTFFGTKLRIIGGLYSGRTSTAQVIIDGIVVGIINEDSATSKTKALVFETTGLSKDVHVVQIKVVDTKILILDAVDIDEDGYLTRTIGSQIATSDVGWKRYDADITEHFGTDWKTVANTTGRVFEGGSVMYSNVIGNYIKFTFTGSKLRLIAEYGSLYDPNVEVSIDGVVEYINLSTTSSSYQPQRLVIEKTALSNGSHEVIVKKTSGTGNFHIDAIDVDINGSVARAIGSQLTAPDAGWKRYDDSSSVFSKFSFTNTSNASQWYGGSYSVLNTPFPFNGSFNRFSFKFTGKKIRIISSISKYRSNNIKLIIDDKEYRYDSGNTSEASYQMLVFEKIDLDDKEHFLIIEADGNTTKRNYDNMIGIEIDAIDIDSKGRIFHPDEVTNITDLEIGKRIRCNYIATTAGTSGAFNNIGKETSDLISTTSIPSTPSGDFYFIVADEYNGKKILIADRPIQAAITWDALNSNGLVFGVLKDLGVKNYTFVARLLSGGYSAADTDNEWDKYVVNSNLNGNINAGDNSVWNWSAGYSTTSTTNANGANRVRRGSTAASTFGAINSATAGGYRPLLEVEALPMNRSFINHEGSYKKYVPQTYIESIENAIPVMTSNTTPSGVASASSVNSSGFDAYKAFNGIQDERYGWASNSPISWLQYQFPQKKIIYKYSLAMRTNSTYYATGEPPKTWTFEGSNDGVNWTILDTQTNNTTLARGVIEEYGISNSKAFTYYRVNISANQGNATITVIAELKMFEKTTVSDGGWKTISATLSLEDTFINDGMDDLSILDRKNENFVASMSANGSLGSGKIFKGSVDLKKYFEITKLSVK